MTEPTLQTRPEHASGQSQARQRLSRHRAEPVKPTRFTDRLGSSGQRVAVIAAACAVLIGVGAAGQASEPAPAYTAVSNTEAMDTKANTETDLSQERIQASAEPAPAAPKVDPQPVPAAAPAPAPEPAPAPAPPPAPEPAPAVAVNDPAGAQAYAASQLGAYGWGADQMQCLQTLWTKESDWETTATNASSGAYGIVQSLPAEKMASAGADYLTNYRTQINWGLNYVKERYGSPCGALNFHLAHNWY